MFASSRSALRLLASSALLSLSLASPALAYFKGGAASGPAPAPKSTYAPGSNLPAYNQHGHYKPAQPVQATQAGVGGFGADAPRTRPVAARPIAVPVLPLLPITGGLQLPFRA